MAASVKKKLNPHVKEQRQIKMQIILALIETEIRILQALHQQYLVNGLATHRRIRKYKKMSSLETCLKSGVFKSTLLTERSILPEYGGILADKSWNQKGFPRWVFWKEWHDLMPKLVRKVNQVHQGEEVPPLRYIAKKPGTDQYSFKIIFVLD